MLLPQFLIHFEAEAGRSDVVLSTPIIKTMKPVNISGVDGRITQSAAAPYSSVLADRTTQTNLSFYVRKQRNAYPERFLTFNNKASLGRLFIAILGYTTLGHLRRPFLQAQFRITSMYGGLFVKK